MKKIKRVFFFLMLIPALVFCQKTLPQKLIIGTDTSCIISQSQVKIINSVFIDRQGCKLIVDSLNTQANNYEKLISQYKLSILSQIRQLSLQKNISNLQNNIIGNDENRLSDLKKQIKLLKLERVILAISTITFAGFYLIK